MCHVKESSSIILNVVNFIQKKIFSDWLTERSPAVAEAITNSLRSDAQGARELARGILYWLVPFGNGILFVGGYERS